MTNELNFNPPFPALTPAQRYHLDVNGYVVVNDVLDKNEVQTLYNVIHRLKDEFMSNENPWDTNIRGASIVGHDAYDNRVLFRDMLEAEPEFLQHASNNRIVGMVEEVVGQRVRLTEQNAYINSRNFNNPYKGPGRYLWHRNRPESNTYTDNGLFHCNFVKSITNLSDIGEDDGGTCVIAGSHKISAPEESIVKASRENPDLIHKVIAPAGSTLIFCETLLHTTGDIVSDRERTIIINGYHPWNRFNESWNNFSDEFKARVPEELNSLIFGTYLEPRLRRRPLGADIGTIIPSNHLDGWSLKSESPDSYETDELSRPNKKEFC